jgi:hypothetical protein
MASNLRAKISLTQSRRHVVLAVLRDMAPEWLIAMLRQAVQLMRWPQIARDPAKTLSAA